jgi:hypothetical protein
MQRVTVDKGGLRTLKSAMGRGWSWYSMVIALVLAVAVPGAPLTRVFSVACQRCPASCPMHQTMKPRCHRAPGTPGCHGNGVTAPCCNQDRSDPLAMTVAPALLPAPTRWWPLIRETRLRWTPVLAPQAAADPPDTPPPIVSA